MGICQAIGSTSIRRNQSEWNILKEIALDKQGLVGLYKRSFSTSHGFLDLYLVQRAHLVCKAQPGMRAGRLPKKQRRIKTAPESLINQSFMLLRSVRYSWVRFSTRSGMQAKPKTEALKEIREAFFLSGQKGGLGQHWQLGHHDRCSIGGLACPVQAVTFEMINILAVIAEGWTDAVAARRNCRCGVPRCMMLHCAPAIARAK